jgi:L-fuconolactonase
MRSVLVKIDTHQHFWIYRPQDYGWIGPGMEGLRRDYLPTDLAPLLASEGIDGTVAVQARQTVEESRWLLELANQNDFIKGVVGWVDLRSPRVGEQLERFVSHPKFRGVRHIVHDEPDDQFMMQDDFRRGIGRLKAYGLTYDLLLFPRHLPVAKRLVEEFPDQPFVLDHISKPPIKEHKIEPWLTDLRSLAASENVFCKVSGMVTEADWAEWKASDFEPYLDAVFECFGTKRIMIGSDWPVSTLAASYSSVVQLSTAYIQRLSVAEQADVWCNNAQSFYRFPS